MQKLLQKLGIESLKGYSFKNEIGDGQASTVCVYENDNQEKFIVKLF